MLQDIVSNYMKLFSNDRMSLERPLDQKIVAAKQDLQSQTGKQGKYTNSL